VSGLGGAGEVRIVELPGHPFFLATLFLPQARSTASRPHPLLAGYAAAAVASREARASS
jgi:CTP synthase (UTP-ammonia lyase)